jgi:hypothetical protein
VYSAERPTLTHGSGGSNLGEQFLKYKVLQSLQHLSLDSLNVDSDSWLDMECAATITTGKLRTRLSDAASGRSTFEYFSEVLKLLAVEPPDACEKSCWSTLKPIEYCCHNASKAFAMTARAACSVFHYVHSERMKLPVKAFSLLDHCDDDAACRSLLATCKHMRDSWSALHLNRFDSVSRLQSNECKVFRH